MKRGCLLFLLVYCALPAFSQQAQLLLPVVANNRIEHAFLSPDGSKLIGSSHGTANDNSEIKVWDTRSRKLIYTLKDNYIDDAAVYITGNSLLSHGYFTVTRWNLNDGGRLWSVSTKKVIDFVTLSHDGRSVMACMADSIRIWNAADGQLLYAGGSGVPALYPAQLSTGDQVLAGAYRGGIYCWDLTKRRVNETFRAAPDFHNKGMENMADLLRLSPDRHYLFAHFFDSTLYIRDLSKPAAAPFAASHITSLSTDSAGDRYVTVEDGIVRVYETAERRLLLQVQPAGRGYIHPGLSTSGKYLLVDGAISNGLHLDNSTRIYDIASGKMTDSLGTGNPFFFSSQLLRNDSILLYTTNQNLKDFLYLNRMQDGKRLGPSQAYTWSANRIWNFALTSVPGHFAVSYGDSTVRVWDLHGFKPNYEFKGASWDLPKLEQDFYIDHRTASMDHYNDPDTVFIRDYTGGRTRTLVLPVNGTIIPEPGGRHLLIDRAMSDTLAVYDIGQQKITANLKKANFNWVSAWFLPATGKVLVSDFNPVYDLWAYDLASGTKEFRLKNSLSDTFTDHDLMGISCSPDGKYVATSSQDRLLIWSIADKKVVREVGKNEFAVITAFCPDGHTFVYGVPGGTLMASDIDGSNSRSLLFHHTAVDKICFNRDGSQMLSVSNDDYTAVVSDMRDGTILKTILLDKGDMLLDADFTNGLAYFSDNATLSVFNLRTGRKVVSLSLVNGDEAVFTTPDNYYSAPPAAAAAMSWRVGARVLSFDQLDTRFNRPDKVMEAMGSADSALISAYRRAWQKRVQYLGPAASTATNVFHVPEADFAERRSIPYFYTGVQLALHISASDSLYHLLRFNVWVNECPVFGAGAIRLNGHSGKLDTIVNVSLSSGDNVLETSVVNSSGAESYKVPLYINCPQPDSGRLYFCGIGIGHFADTQHPLQWSVADIRKLAGKLKSLYGSRITIDTLFDRNVTLASVKALKHVLQKTSVNDRVIVAFSGHGLLDKNKDYFLSAYETDFNDPAGKSIPYKTLLDLVDSIPARKKLVLLDACNSGEVDKSSKAKTAPSAGRRINLVSANSHLGLQDSFALMQELFANVNESTGATVIAAASGTQSAFEKGDLKAGIFTFSLLECLDRNPHCSVSELKAYVSRRVVELSGGKQVPATRSDNHKVDWPIW